MVHVLPGVHSTSYPAILGVGRGAEGSSTDLILDGCVCARCGSRDLQLMRCWIPRWLWLLEAMGRLLVRLARCQTCKARERILPYDALPSKQAGVQVVIECVSEVERHPGSRLAQAVEALLARGVRISRQLLAKWIAGIRARGNDLFELLRHRALIAPPGCAPTRQLVSFGRTRHAMMSACVLRNEPGPKDGLSLVLQAIRAFGRFEGLARFGAAEFRQAVLLFRSPRTGTPSCLGPGEPRGAS